MKVLAPISGGVIPLSEVADEVFAEGMAGEGCAIAPSGSGEVVAPISGRLVRIVEGGHAFAIESDDGVELTVHVGLDTLELRGDGFEVVATQGDRVKAAETVVRFDIQKIRDAGYDPVTPVVVTNPEDHSIGEPLADEVMAGDELFEVSEVSEVS